MEVKKIQNDYHLQLCGVVRKYCDKPKDAQECFSSMKEASYDDNGKIYLYDYFPDMEIVKLDKLTTIFNSQRQGTDYTPNAVDAVCINSNNEWFLIEFKNSSFYKINKDKANLNSSGKDAKKKMLSSLWFLFSLYSMTGNPQQDVTNFARNHITYILVYSQEKNPAEALKIHMAESNGTHFTPPDFEQYKGYYFKDIYLYTERELRTFIANFI